MSFELQSDLGALAFCHSGTLSVVSDFLSYVTKSNNPFLILYKHGVQVYELFSILRLAMEELMSEAKRAAERAKDMGAIGW